MIDIISSCQLLAVLEAPVQVVGDGEHAVLVGAGDGGHPLRDPVHHVPGHGITHGLTHGLAPGPAPRPPTSTPC